MASCARNTRVALIAVMAMMIMTAGAWAAPRQDREAEVDMPEEVSFTLPQVIQMLREGAPSSRIVSRIKQLGTTFDLTVDDLVRLQKVGASNELLLLMAGTTEPPAPPAPGSPATEAAEAAAPEPGGALTIKQVLRMNRKGVPAGEIADRIAREGLVETPDLDDLLHQREKGVPDEVILALARGGAARVEAGAAAPERRSTAPDGPMTASEVIAMVEAKELPPQIAATVSARGMAAPLTLEEALALREAGATDEVISAVNQAASAAPAAPAAPAASATRAASSAPAAPPDQEAATDIIAVPLSEQDLARSRPSDPAEDRVWVTSVPEGARVHVSPATTQRRDAADYDYYVGDTPMQLTLDPGEYNIVISKEADAFDEALLPAWRTVQDLPDTLTVLDNADLTFDPAHCCLPGGLARKIDTYPVSREQPRSAIGVSFGGLPPYLFDSETIQIMRVSASYVTEVLKLYKLRKNAGESRLLVGLFIPAEGDPLDQSAVKGLPFDHPFDPYVDAPELSYLTEPASASGFASALGVSPDHLADAVAMLRRTGKAILHQQLPGGVRLVTLMVDDGVRLRLVDRLIRPMDPLAPPPPEPKGRKKKAEIAQTPPPPPLPEPERVVVPGLGLPRLVINNTGGRGVGLVFDDGQFCYVEGKTQREFTIDPGTFQVRMLSADPPETVPQGRLHFSYHARYTITF